MADTSIILRLLDSNEAKLVGALLESYGIPVSVTSESLPMLVYPTNIGEVLISVPEEYRELALETLAAHRAAWKIAAAAPERGADDRAANDRGVDERDDDDDEPLQRPTEVPKDE